MGPSGKGDFGDSTDTQSRPEVIFTPTHMAARGACSDGWAYNWRSTGQASLCLEADGCLWRKFDSRDGRKPQVKDVADSATSQMVQRTYSIQFINYLSRFILNFDPRWMEHT